MLEALLSKFAKRFQENFSELQTQLAKEEIELQEGAGECSVKIVVNGMGLPKSIEISKGLLNTEAQQELQALILSAITKALLKASERRREELSKILGGLPIPEGLI